MLTFFLCFLYLLLKNANDMICVVKELVFCTVFEDVMSSCLVTFKRKIIIFTLCNTISSVFSHAKSKT